MNKSVKALILTLSILATTGISSIASAQVFPNINYTVKAGDSIWRICYKYQVGVSEVIAANPQISNPNMIYVNQIIKVPNLTEVKVIEKQVVTMVNTERAKVGLAPLKLNWQLSRVARYKSQDMIDKNYFSHQSPTYGSPFDMMKNFGIKYMSAGENIAYGQRTATEVMTVTGVLISA
ncbi:LysM peptidoglycan-binding domain-containing protein [Clostridium sp.]|uniref:LysM peptidoglycan-binding domain-containing protein n=1 Tax=Clostridium sp. TaxID=1506 RepID=UPI001A51A70E|nr:LysM peptidoglycan-binding domain-containing protein [Clostridium sp.]MBK5236172.1 LysM peptidoglycan-binding domain-containing protein [Clostridium sp.]